MTAIDAPTLVDALQSNAQTDECGIRYIDGRVEEEKVSYSALLEQASGLLGALQTQGVEPGDELILLVETNQEFVEVFWAALLGGIVAVPLAIGAGDVHFQKLLNVFKKLQRPKLYATEKNLRRFEKFTANLKLDGEYARIHSRTVLAKSTKDNRQPGQIQTRSADQTAFIQFSSGSTGDPKGVVLTHHNVMTNVRAILESMRIRDTDSSLSWMPMTHDMGIIGFHLAPLVANAPLYLMPTELFVRRPMLWVQKISEKRATITASPNFGLKHLLKRFNAEPGEIDLSCIRLIFNGAEPISALLCREFAKTLQPFGYSAKAMFPVYGLAEASLAVTFSEPESKLKSVHVRRESLTLHRRIEVSTPDQPGSIELVSVGAPIGGSELKVVDDQEERAADEYVGHILIRGANVTTGYYQDHELNRRVFKQDGWLDTGDLGFIKDGQLFIAGREKDLIIIHGQNYHPHDLETICESVEQLELGKVATCSLLTENSATESLVIFIVHRGSIEPFVDIVRQVRRCLNAEIGLDAEFVIPVRAIPKTTSGKLQRYLLVNQFLKGDFDAVHQEIQALLRPISVPLEDGEHSVEERLLMICRSVIEDREFGVEDNLFEIGTSSLMLAQIHERIEEAFPGRVEISDLFENPSILELTAFLGDQEAKGK